MQKEELGRLVSIQVIFFNETADKFPYHKSFREVRCFWGKGGVLVFPVSERCKHSFKELAHTCAVTYQKFSASGCRDWILCFVSEGAYARTWTETTHPLFRFLFKSRSCGPQFCLLLRSTKVFSDIIMFMWKDCDRWLNYRTQGHLFTSYWITIVPIVFRFVLQKVLTHVKQVVQSGPAFCNCSNYWFWYKQKNVNTMQIYFFCRAPLFFEVKVQNKDLAKLKSTAKYSSCAKPG